MRAFGGVHHQRDVVVLQAVHDVRATFPDLVDLRRGDAFGRQPSGCAFGGDQFKAKRDQVAQGGGEGRGLVHVLDRHKDATSFGQHNARAHLRLEEGEGEGAVPAHDLTGGAHFRAKHRVNAGETGKGQHSLFDAEPRGDRIGERMGIGQRQGAVGADACGVGRAVGKVRQRLTRHQPRGDGGDGAVGGLGDEGHGARRARVHFQNVDHAVFDGELHVHQAHDVQRARHNNGLALQLFDNLGRKLVRRQAAGTVARMDARLFDVFHNARDMDVCPVGQGVNIHLDRARKVAVQKHRAVARDLHGGGDIAFQLRIITDDFHRAATQHERGADDQGVSHVFGHRKSLIPRPGGAVVGLLEAEILQKALEPLTIFGQINGVGGGAKDRDTFGMERIGQFQRRLSAELHDHPMKGAVFLLDPQDFQHMLQGQRFEIEPVRGVIVGRHGFGVAVDHDGFIARRRQRIAGMAAAIVKLDPLTNPVRAAAQDHDLFGIRRAGFTFHIAHRGGFVGGIHIGCLRLKLGGAGVDPFEHGRDAEIAARAADLGLIPAGQFGKAGIGKAHHFQLAQAGGGHGQARFAHLGLGVDDFADAVQEPRVKGGGGDDFVIGQTKAHGLGDDAQAVGRGIAQRLHDRGFVGRAGDGDFVKSGQPGFQRCQRLLQGFVDGAANRHRLTHRFHGGGQVRDGAGELFKGKARDLGHDIVNRRLKAGGRHLGDVVVQLVQRVADRQFGGDLGDGEARGLGRQCRGAADARVHLDHDHAAIGGVDRPLHVGAACFHPDLAQHGNRAVAHDLVFLVGQRQGRGDRDAVARVHAHRVDVFDGADDDGVVGLVADNLHLEFFPTQQRFIDQNLRHGAGFKA